MPKLSATELDKLADVVSDGSLKEESLAFISALRFPKKLEDLRDDPNVPSIGESDGQVIDLIAGLLSLFIQSGLLKLLFTKRQKP